MTKFEAIKRVARLVEFLKQMKTSNCRTDIYNEIVEYEEEIKLLENELSLIIDEYMAHRYRIYNSNKRVGKIIGSKLVGELSGVWNTKSNDKLAS